MINFAKASSKTFFNVLLLLGIFFSFNTSVQASHLMGSDITYQCLGNYKYKITLTVYRDCGGIALGSSFSMPIKCKI